MSLMCHADTTIIPFHWRDDLRTPAPTWAQKHECIDWDRLTEWLDTRVIDIHEPGMLVHPMYGLSFPDGQPS